MELNQIRLPASVIADLYKNSLVQDESAEARSAVAATVAPEAANEPEKPIQFLGKNQQHICILVSYPKDVYLPEEQLNFLTNILQACRLNMGDVAIVNHYRYTVSFGKLQEELQCRHLLIFGIQPSTIAIEIGSPEFIPQVINDCPVVFCPPLDHFNNNADGKLLKSKLWICLKQLFNV